MSKRPRDDESDDIEQRLINLRRTMEEDSSAPPPSPSHPPPPLSPPPPPPSHPPPLRFVLKERVACKISQGQWLTGKVAMLHEPDPHGGSVLPYVVSLDRSDRMISAPSDNDDCVRIEACFTEAEWHVSRSLSAGRSSLALRFKAGDVVACLAASLGHGRASADWRRARVRQVWPSLDLDEPRKHVPYLLELLDEGVPGGEGGEGGEDGEDCVDGEGGAGLLCHRDDHYLVRDLALQPPGPRTDRSRFATRQCADGSSFEELDHQTRVVRSTEFAAPAPKGDRDHGQLDDLDDDFICALCVE